MWQQIIIVGNLGSDPELRYLPNGDPVATMSVATSNKWTDSQGQVKEETCWFRVSVYGKQAEICNQFLAKGRRVLVVGKLKPDEKTGGPRTYERKDGTWGASYEIRGETVRFLSPKSEGAGEPSATDEPF